MSEINLGPIVRSIDNLERQLQRSVRTLGGQIEQVDGEVRDVKAVQAQTKDRLEVLYDKFLEFVGRTERIAAAQRAEVRIVRINDELEHGYGHHKVVRRTATGILQAFDTGLVQEETVRQVSEELMIQTPRYWLAPALVGLAAWAGDDEALCARAVEEAFRRSTSKTSLFYALILRRQGRQEASVRWLRHYLEEQDPRALGREFQVILECVSQGAFGPPGRQLLARTLEEWRQRLLDDDTVRAAQAGRWRQEIDSLRAPSATDDFPRLAEVCPQWAALDDVLARARAHEALLNRFRTLMESEILPAHNLEDTVDDILDNLVRNSDEEELPLQRELMLNEAIVRHEGDEEAARKEADMRSEALEETRNYLSVQSVAALDPAAVGASPAAQRLAVASCQEWFAQAHAGFSRDYRAAVPPKIEISLANTFGVSHGTQRFKLTTWTKPLTDDLPDLEASLTRHWSGYVEMYVKSLAYDYRSSLALLGAAVTAILVIFLGVHVGFAVIAAIAVGGTWGVVLYNRADAARTAQEQARELLGRHMRETLDRLRGAHAELTDWQQQYWAADFVEAEARQFIASLNTAAHAPSPFEGRVVGAGD
ncbi:MULTISPECIES: hypothetical protein [Streptomyces]|uniref:Small basic protein n=1 Tax=Streptomyces stelliscabiei TaxID=146820 RepID=A0A8I0NX27_9ACTN|nr:MULTISPECIES: hypothetical protein [Streptomyces]KND46365.1 hypothetical protein IQ64_01705 [Streptomyces stelliscabiei]MBE1595198.1 small basic protein [Streptomyces stelliscabiei]MDX2516159.1 hypothetical protein [Streptomyces stelliscabiei]MDX2553131.1 hypothetical protein [Streptomyces stelliscabiei]MDX2612119.1 hypothetical protein [Streptomyces stelliscabiei]